MDSSPTIARLKEFGTWTEQTSSSGKRYYYNSATNISQWEKPTEWKHAEKLRASASSLKNGSSNGGHPSVVQQMPKVTKPVVENEKVSSSLPSIRLPHHHQPNLYKQSTPTVSSSTPTFRPGISTPLSVRTIPTSSAPQILSTPSCSSFQQLKRPLEKSPSSINDSFCEEKYQKFWRPDLSGGRRVLGVDSFAFEIRKSADRQAKQMSAIFALDKDIHSIRTLERTARLRTTLLKQRIAAVRQRTQELESKPQ